MAEQWLSIVEYARTYAISDMTVRRRIKTGRLKAVLKEGKYYIPVDPSPEPRGDRPPAQIPSQRLEPIKQAPLSYGKPPVLNDKPEPTPLAKPPSPTWTPSAHEEVQALRQAIGRFDQLESLYQSRYQAEVRELKAKIALLENEIKSYQQQVEDLQLLVKAFEAEA